MCAIIMSLCRMLKCHLKDLIIFWPLAQTYFGDRFHAAPITAVRFRLSDDIIKISLGIRLE